MTYIDGFVIPVPAGNRDAYRDAAAKAAPIFRQYGATRIVECWGDDLPDGDVTDFRGAVKAEGGETVVFSWIVFRSRAHRDRVNAKVMEDPRLADMMEPEDAPFDAKRMIYGGFQIAVKA